MITENYQIHNVNSVDMLDVIKPESVHLVVTSPPYFNQRKEYAEYDGVHDYFETMESIVINCYQALKPGCIICLNIGQDRDFDLPSKFSMLLERCHFKYIDTLCWDKMGEIGTRGVFLETKRYYPNFRWEPIFIYQKPYKDYGMGIKEEEFPQFEEEDINYVVSNRRANLWQIVPERNSEHPAAYPITLAMDLIRCYSKKGQTVLDPFGGSGTTALAAERLGRKSILFEYQEEYYKLINKRLSQGDLGL